MLIAPALTGALEDLISLYWNNPAQPAEEFVKSFADALQTAL